MDKRRRRSVFNWLYMLVRRDFWRKLIALFFALLLYFYVYNEIRAPQKVDNVPVDIILPPELMDVDPKPHFVTLEVKSTRNSGVSPSALRGRAQVDYNRYIPGKPYILTLKPEEFDSPLGVRVIQADPREITLNLQQRMTRDVPVRVTFSNRLSNDYKSSLASCIPSTVRVTGPEPADPRPEIGVDPPGSAFGSGDGGIRVCCDARTAGRDFHLSGEGHLPDRHQPELRAADVPVAAGCVADPAGRQAVQDRISGAVAG